MKLDPSLPQSFLNVDPSSPLASATSPAGSSGFFLSPCRSPDLRVPRVYPRVANLLTFRVRSFWPFWIACPYPCLWSVPSFVVCIKGINDFGIDSDLFHELPSRQLSSNLRSYRSMVSMECVSWGSFSPF